MPSAAHVSSTWGSDVATGAVSRRAVSATTQSAKLSAAAAWVVKSFSTRVRRGLARNSAITVQVRRDRIRRQRTQHHAIAQVDHHRDKSQPFH